MLAPMACSSDNGKTGPDVKPVVPPVQKETGIEIGKVLPAWQKGEMDPFYQHYDRGARLSDYA